VPSGRDIWFTEVGSRVDHGKNTQVSQSVEVEHLLTNVADARRGAKRLWLYYYPFREPSLNKARIFDSGVLAPDDPQISEEMHNAPRIAYDSYRGVTNP
jgi:hypothetical protein